MKTVYYIKQDGRQISLLYDSLQLACEDARTQANATKKKVEVCQQVLTDYCIAKFYPVQR